MCGGASEAMLRQAAWDGEAEDAKARRGLFVSMAARPCSALHLAVA